MYKSNFITILACQKPKRNSQSVVPPAFNNYEKYHHSCKRSFYNETFKIYFLFRDILIKRL
ncbi:hypothetical protein HMPREF0322_03746 [Desulfitobacterium hafniense DP7]|uniref:Uncharacterized protein n=1 Tax=Desulfitobacterium hafniense DP7 TaxID=537010 RepID=G9XRZ8_DESHA|nr:hypothetical protein HMPREF0322_03746 [Desulfitobacterium hafniense DP7]